MNVKLLSACFRSTIHIGQLQYIYIFDSILDYKALCTRGKFIIYLFYFPLFDYITVETTWNINNGAKVTHNIYGIWLMPLARATYFYLYTFIYLYNYTFKGLPQGPTGSSLPALRFQLLTFQLADQHLTTELLLTQTRWHYSSTPLIWASNI